MLLMRKIKCKESATKNKVSDIGNFDHYFFREDLDGKQCEASGVQNTADNGNTRGLTPQELAQNPQSNPALAANEICLLNRVNQIEILPQYQVLMDKLKEEVIQDEVKFMEFLEAYYHQSTTFNSYNTSMSKLETQMNTKE